MINETSQLEHVVVQNGTILNPIHLNVVVMTINLICSIIGIPINFFIACVIISMKRLRSKPRNISLLGLVLSNLSAFVPGLLEFSYLLSPSDELCQLYVAIVGLPYVLFLTNMLLALGCRYSAIAHPLWHMKKVSVRLVVGCQLVASISISVIYKFAYVAQFVPLSCAVPLLQVRIIAVVLLILFSCCVVAQIIVYRRTTAILANYTPKATNKKRNSSKTTNNETPIVVAAAQLDHVDFQVYDASNSDAQQTRPVPATTGATEQPESLSVHMSDSSINQLEIEATTTLIASVTSLTIMTGPFILFTFSMFVCRLVFEKSVCSSISWLAPYFKELVVLHAVYHPIINLNRSSELSTAMKKWFNK